jgi:hypothetical protein
MRKSILLLSLLLFSGILKAQTLTSSNLPIVVIQTYGNATIADEPKIPAFMGIIKNAPGVRNNITDPYSDYSGKIYIEQRGASSQMFSQKQYKIITVNGMDTSIDVPILGMPAEHDWVLYAPYNDKTLMRNYMIYNLTREMGRWAPRTEYCEVIVNGEYRGVYVMVENVKRGKKRVNVAKMDEDDNAGDSLTGGYIFRSDWDGGFVHYPKNATVAQTNYITSAVDNLTNLLSQPNFNDPVTGYNKYIKAATFIDYMLIVEFCNNQDSYHASTYFHKENIASDSGAIKAGPVWDYNFAFGISPWYGALDSGWIYEKAGTGMNGWMNQLMQDTNYANKARCRWDWLRKKTLDTVYVYHKMDSIANLLSEARQRHFTKYPILTAGSCSDCYNNYSPLTEPSTYEGDLQYMKDWLYRRVTWIDANLPGTCHEAGIDEKKSQQAYLLIYPNPVEDKLYIDLFLNETSPVSYELYSATGQLVLQRDLGDLDANDHIIAINEFASPPSGLYLLKVNTGGSCISKTVIKK